MADNANSLEGMDDETRNQLATMYTTLANDPKTRQQLLRLTKTVAPNTPIPEIDVLDRVAAGVKPYADKITAMEKAELDRQVKERIRDNREALKAEGYSQAEIDAAEKIMVEKSIPDHKTAAEFFRLQNKAATPTPANYVGVTKLPINREQLKEAGGIKRWGQIEAHAAIDDLRSGRVRLS